MTIVPWSRGLHLSSQLPALDCGFKGLLTSGSSANTRRAPLGRHPPSCSCQQRRRVRASSEAARGSAASGSELLVEQPDTSAAEPESLTVPEVGNNIVPASVLRSSDNVEVLELEPGAQNAWARRLRMLKTILVFAGPALSIPLGDPLMSLVDTVCIGQYASTLELAALGPNTLIFQFATYVVAALATATTCLMSEHLHTKRRDRAGSVLSTSLLLGTAIGSAQSLILLVWGPRLIAATGCAAELMAPAWSYLSVRALSAPSVLLLMVAQAGLLAQKDSWTPCFGVLIQLVLNCVGDVVLIGHMQLGLAGAAWATVVSQWAGTLVTLWALPRRGRVQPKLRWSREDVSHLSETFGPATLILLCKNIVYAAVQATASALTPLQAAAHMPIYAVWNLGGFAHVPLEQAALAFLPPARAKGQARETVQLLLGLAVAVGLVTSALTAGLPTLLPQLFSNDPALFPHIRSVAPQAMLSIFLCSLDVCSGGILVASKDLSFLVRVMTAALGVVLGCLYAINRRGLGLGSIWWTLVIFFAFRAANSLSRLLYLARKPGSFLHRDSQSADGSRAAGHAST